MKRLLWKRRVAFLLAFAMLFTQFSVPKVYASQAVPDAENDKEKEVPQVMEIPEEYISLNDLDSQNIVDLSKVEESEPEVRRAGSSEDIPEEYKNIPVIGENLDDSSQAAAPEEMNTVANEGAKASEEALPETIPYIDGEMAVEPYRNAVGLDVDGDEVGGGDETIIPENSIGVDEFVEDEILIGNEWQKHYFTPDEDNSYLLAAWSSEWLNISVSECEGETLNGIAGTSGTRCIQAMNLTAGKTYCIEILSPNQCTYHLGISKLKTITAENSATISTSARLVVGTAGKASIMTLNVDSVNGCDYYVVVGGQEVPVSDDESYKLVVMGEQEVVLWKEDAAEDQITVGLQGSEVQELVMADGGNRVSRPMDGNAVLSGEWKTCEEWVKFTPKTSGKYLAELSGTAGSTNDLYGYLSSAYVLTESGFNYMVMGSCNYVELEKDKTYLLKLGSSPGIGLDEVFENVAVTITKLQEETIALGEEKEIIPLQGKYIFAKLPNLEFGAYEIRMQGSQADYTVYTNNITGGTKVSLKAATEGKITEAFNGAPDGMQIVIAAADGRELGTIELSVKKTDEEIRVDGEKCWKQPVEMTDYDKKWFAFTPDEDGNYVFCTEEKYSNNYTTVTLYEKNENYLFQLTGDYAYDNNHLAYELKEGTTYYYCLYGNAYEQVSNDTFTVALYPEKTVSLTDKEASTDSIRKAVAYQVTIPRAGFYNLGVSGQDASYILKIQNAEESDVKNQSFVYNGIPRSFLFKKAGTYTIWVMKEVMSDEVDEITFTYEAGATAAKLTSGKSLEVDIDSTDGVWLEFVPDKTGWYSLDLREKDGTGLYNELSVLSEDGSEIVWDRNLPSYNAYDYQDNGGDEGSETHQRFYGKLVSGRTYYYNVGSWWNATGHVTATVGNAAQEITMTEAAEKIVSMPENLFVLKTDFQEDQLLYIVDEKDKDFEDGQYGIGISDITGDISNPYMSYLSRKAVLFVPKGQREYLVGRHSLETPKITITPREHGNLETTVSVQFSKSKEDEWLKFTPERSGFYTLYAETNIGGDISPYHVEDGKLYYVVGLEDSENGKISATSYLQQGETYYYQVRCWEEDAENVEIEYMLLDSDGQDGSISVGTNQVSVDKIWIGKDNITESGYYKAKIESGAERIDITRFSVCNGMIVSYASIAATQEGTNLYLDVDTSEEVSNYVKIVADGEVEISFEKMPMKVQTINFGDSIEETADGAYKEYHFTPVETGTYSFVITSNDISPKHKYETKMVMAKSNKNVKLYAKSRENLTEWKSRYSCRCNLKEGIEYIYYVLEDQAYTLNLTKTTDKYVYDYDYYTAFIASGGTIQLVDSITEDMWEDCDNEYASYNDVNGKYLYFSAKNFKDEYKNEIWFPSWERGSEVYENVRDNEITYQSILNNLNDRYEEIYKVTDLYQTDSADVSKSSKADLSAKLSANNEIILAKYVPAIIHIQTIKLEGLTALEVGQKTKVTATTSTGNQYEATNPNLVFESSNPSVLTVDAAGNVEAKSAGEAKVICKSADGNAKAELVVTVKSKVVYVEKVTVSGAKEVNVGSSTVLTAKTDTNEKGNPTVGGVNWSSSDNSIATVDANGKVTGLKEGSVTITAVSKDGHAKGSITIQVKAVLAQSISIKDSKILMKKGTTYKWLKYTIKPENTTDKTVILSSSNSKVVAVTASGNLKAKAVGTAEITAKTINGKSDTVKVTVTASDIKAKKLKLDKSIEVMAGGKITLKPEFTPVNTTNQKLDYTSSDTDVATVNSKGVVTTKKAGKVTITAKTKDGSKKTAKCKITVKGPGKTTLNKIDNSQKGTAILSWKEVKEADGYEIYMSTDKKKYNKIQTVKKSSVTTFTMKKLKSKTTYYFKVVTYVNVGKGKKAYGGESKVVKVKIK